jgi:hypothetical protein
MTEGNVILLRLADAERRYAAETPISHGGMRGMLITYPEIRALLRHAIEQSNRIIALESTVGPCWIAVTDRMPEASVSVLAVSVPPRSCRVISMAQYAPRWTLLQSEHGDPDAGGDYDESRDEYYVPEGWYETNEFEETHWRINGQVTHWMPLPLCPPSGS